MYNSSVKLSDTAKGLNKGKENGGCKE